MSLIYWALWGLAGAVLYAAPRLVTSIFDPPTGTPRHGKALAEFLVAISAGPITSAGLGGFIIVDLGPETEAKCRALALMIGLIVNPVAPSAVELFTNIVLARIGHPLARRRKAP